ncbi:MAG: hypothetical protein AAFO95_07820 [Cyanobacteria bacterium J06600_6]
MRKKHLKQYRYIGSPEIKDSVANYPIGTRITSQEDLKTWLDNNKESSEYIVCTFIIDLEGYLRIANRHSEHVACSGGESVMSAGEIFFSLDRNQYQVVEISNQSTGFCPEPESWIWVSQALERIPLIHPGNFTNSFIFRRCIKCNLLNIVKNDSYICADCNAGLPLVWNCELTLLEIAEPAFERVWNNSEDAEYDKL